MARPRSRFTRRGRTAKQQPEGELLSLEAIERLLGGGPGRRPSDHDYVRETARVLHAMAGRQTGELATLVCEEGPRGMRIVEGCESLQVARELRARAAWRGDHRWAALMGRRIAFRVITP